MEDMKSDYLNLREVRGMPVKFDRWVYFCVCACACLYQIWSGGCVDQCLRKCVSLPLRVVVQYVYARIDSTVVSTFFSIFFVILTVDVC